ncbi:MBL fold metallo-hydrolase [Caldithrix abyssi]|nr:MBL fold metallo-hydrolase [Caldithrix abyssi]
MTHFKITYLRVFFLFIPVYAQTNLQPQEIIYDGIPGFDSNMGEVYEWSSTTNGLQRITTPDSGLRIRWLGTFGFEISDDETTLLIDPFISRQKPMALLKPLEIDTVSVQHYLLNPMDASKLAAILVTHSHYDHIEDVPYILAQFSENRSPALSLSAVLIQ